MNPKRDLENQNYYKELLELRKLKEEQTQLITELSNTLSAKTLAFDSLLKRMEAELKRMDAELAKEDEDSEEVEVVCEEYLHPDGTKYYRCADTGVFYTEDGIEVTKLFEAEKRINHILGDGTCYYGCANTGAFYTSIEIEKTLPKEKEKEPTKKQKKKAISSTIKRLVWNINIGEYIGKAKCLCCKSTDIIQMSFHCGHIIAEANGGESIVSNLKPICQNCNSSMGTKNMNEFMKSLK